MKDVDTADAVQSTMTPSADVTQPSIETVRELLRDLCGHFETYHNHKETMGWSAVALFHGAALAIGSFGFEKSLSTSTDFFLSFPIVLIYALALIFVRDQLHAKNYASDIVGACNRLLFDVEGRTVSPEDLGFPCRKGLPRLVMDEAAKYGEERRAGRKGIRDSLRHVVQRLLAPGRGHGAPKRKAKLVHHERQELIIVGAMTMTMMITIAGVVLPPTSFGTSDEPVKTEPHKTPIKPTG